MNFKSSKIKLYIILGILCCVVFVTSFTKAPKVSMVKYEDTNFTLATKGLVIKGEAVYYSPQNGSVKYCFQDGEMVPKGFIAAYVTGQENVSLYKNNFKKLINVINKSAYNASTNSIFKNDINKINQQINDELTKLQLYIQTQKISYIYDSYGKLQALVEKRLKIAKEFGINSSEADLEELNRQKSYVEELINSRQSTFVTNKGGILTKNIDGYESLLSTSNYTSLSADKILSIINGQNHGVSRNESGETPVYKLINSYSWHYLTVINKDKLGSFKAGDSVSIDFNRQKANAAIYSIRSDGDKYIVDCKLNEMLGYVYNKRIVSGHIITKDLYGYSVPKTSVVKKKIIKVSFEGKLDKSTYSVISSSPGDFLLYFSKLKTPVKAALIRSDLFKKGFQISFIIEGKDIKLKKINKFLAFEKGKRYTFNVNTTKYTDYNGIYVERIGVVSFVPINLVGTIKDTAIVKNLDPLDYTENYGQVKYYDNAVINPDSVKTNEVI